jgi:cell division protein FtsB
MLIYQIIIGVLVAFIILLLYITRNLLIKNEKYEDVVQDQVRYLQNISNTIQESRQHLNTLDERGVFQSDDEVGEFFNQMKEVQNELDRYMLPENYGKEEKQS